MSPKPRVRPCVCLGPSSGARARVRWLLAGLLSAVAAAACSGGSTPVDPGDDDGPGDPPDPSSIPPVAVPALGAPATLDVVTWNLLHFGAPNSGPTDEALQMARARDVILGTDADLWAVQEVTSAGAFADLLELLPGYGGLLANDPSVQGGTESYSDGELKVGLVYKTSAVEVGEARIVLAGLAYEFAGRPPLEVRVRWLAGTGGGAGQDAVVLVLHAKADTQAESWERRRAAAVGLAAYLDATWPDRPVLVPGDWNDDLDESIVPGRDTPYRAFLDAAPDWVFPTERLGAGGATSVIGFDDVIDHVLASNEAMAWYEAGSAQIHQVDEHVPRYRETTSDHLPVLARFLPTG